ncbi:caspase domain-containing protein [Lactarius quietus]|nr:caspase domain-containing protein [Lactarius quietus]
MAPHFTLSRVPIYCQSPTASPPKHRALLIGINYASSFGNNEQRYCELNGPVNNAKAMKKALIDIYGYNEEDIFLMTHEGANRDTALWPSRANIMHAMRNFVRDAVPGDTLVFFYAGHSDQQTDVNEIDGLDECIVTCDHEIILGNTLRENLIDPLPGGARLTTILDTDHAATLLDLGHNSSHTDERHSSTILDLDRYSGHISSFSLPSTLQARSERHYEGPRHRHSNDETQHWLIRGATWLFYIMFSFIAMITFAILRFMVRLVKKRKQVKVDPELGTMDCVDHPVMPSLSSIPRPPCCSSSCVNASSSNPLVISVSSCSDQQSMWEDGLNRGNSLTTNLVEILRKNPSINVGDLNQHLQTAGEPRRDSFQALTGGQQRFQGLQRKIHAPVAEEVRRHVHKTGFVRIERADGAGEGEVRGVRVSSRGEDVDERGCG